MPGEAPPPSTGQPEAEGDSQDPSVSPGGDMAPPPADGPQPQAGVPNLDPTDPHTGPSSQQDGPSAVPPDPDLEDYDGPLDLESAGLYRPGTQTLVEDLFAYDPQFPLWSDGAKKRRYLHLPKGTQIDTSDMDHWVFPLGTRAFKEFVAVDPTTGVETRVETRLLEKRQDGWLAISFIWNEAQTAAKPSPYGAPDVLGTQHDVPAQEDCMSCHQAIGDWLLGVDAIQLSQAGEPGRLTLSSLRAGGWLTVDTGTDRFELPGAPAARAALGMMHSNCGSCHRPGNMAFERTDLELTLSTSALETVEGTAAYRTSVGMACQKRLDEFPLRIEAGAGPRSAMVGRMLSRDPLVAMPPLASEIPDTAGADILSTWIDGL